MPWIPQMTTGHRGTVNYLSTPVGTTSEWILSGHKTEIVREPQLMGFLSLSRVLLPGGCQSCEILPLTALWGWLRKDSQGMILASMVRLYFLWQKPVSQSTAQHKMVTKQHSIRRPIGIDWFHKRVQRNAHRNKTQVPDSVPTNCVGTASENTFHIHGSLFMSSWTQ